jgi:hypothetical protein
VRSCEHDTEPLGSIKGGEFLDKLSDCWLLMKDSDPWDESVFHSNTFVKARATFRYVFVLVSVSQHGETEGTHTACI